MRQDTLEIIAAAPAVPLFAAILNISAPVGAGRDVDAGLDVVMATENNKRKMCVAEFFYIFFRANSLEVHMYSSIYQTTV